MKDWVVDKPTRESLTLLIARSFDPIAFASGLKQCNDGTRDCDRQTLAILRAANATDAILANARIVPLEVTDEMADALNKAYDVADFGRKDRGYDYDAINAAIEAGKLK